MSKNTKSCSKKNAHEILGNVVEEDLCRQAFALFDKNDSGTISKMVCIKILFLNPSVGTLQMKHKS